MHLHWTIRTKLKIGLALSLVTVAALFFSAHYGLYSYRGLVRSLAARSAELPLASEVRQCISDLRVTLCQAAERVDLPGDTQCRDMTGAGEEGGAAATGGSDPTHGPTSSPLDAQLLREHYRRQLDLLSDAIERYRRQLVDNQQEPDARLGDYTHEQQTLASIDRIVARLNAGQSDSPALEGELSQGDRVDAWPREDWVLDDLQIGQLRSEVEELHRLSALLPSYLHERFRELARDVRHGYRTAIVSAWTAAGAAIVLLCVAMRLFYAWFAKPLKQLWRGSQLVAAGDLDHRIRLESTDEMGQLASAMNAMTERFCEIRSDLDRQVRERTNQVVRSEQLASVGFLAAGVSHEINNPLASIALCSESLESRLQDLLQGAETSHTEDVRVARNYLQMIQREAFRCKQITEKLLDFARRGDSQRHRVELRELVAGVLEMVQHLGRYNDRRLELVAGPPVTAEVSAQEIKQVVLNLVTNALESVDRDGHVRVAVTQEANQVRITVEDDGCGMTEEVQKHLFEPFYTHRRTGQGIGLGLSITHRIVVEHRGTIEASSEGAGKGSRFVVRLPATNVVKEESHRYQAA